MKPMAFNAAFTILTASCTSVQLPCAWGFCVLGAVVCSPRHEQLKCCSSGSVDDGTKMPGRMTRAGVLGVFGGALVVAARNSLAAIPTTDDYAFGTGSKVENQISCSGDQGASLLLHTTAHERFGPRPCNPCCESDSRSARCTPENW